MLMVKRGIPQNYTSSKRNAWSEDCFEGGGPSLSFRLGYAGAPIGSLFLVAPSTRYDQALQIMDSRCPGLKLTLEIFPGSI